MSETLLMDDTLAPSFEGFESLDGLVREPDSDLQEDLSLCFVCMKWASGNRECRIGNACDLQADPGRGNNEP
jgi:hypothetical protein